MGRMTPQTSSTSDRAGLAMSPLSQGIIQFNRDVDESLIFIFSAPCGDVSVEVKHSHRVLGYVLTDDIPFRVNAPRTREDHVSTRKIDLGEALLVEQESVIRI